MKQATLMVEYKGFDQNFDRLLQKVAGLPLGGTGYAFYYNTRDVSFYASVKQIEVARACVESLRLSNPDLSSKICNVDVREDD